MFIIFGAASIRDVDALDWECITQLYKYRSSSPYGRYIEYMYYGFDGDESGVIEIEPKSAAYEFSEQILQYHPLYAIPLKTLKKV